jgi:hypothetical protein
MAQNNVPDWVTKLDAKRQATAKRVIAEAQAQGVPRELALGMAMQESGFDQSKKSKTGPTGVMMLGKAAAKDMGVNRYNEAENIRGGVKYMKMMLDKYNNDVDKALIAYHDGPNSNYFTTGQASPAALNHIQKVRGYAGYQPMAPQSTQTTAPQVAQATQTAAPQGVQPMAKENKLGSGTYQVAPLDLDALDEIDKITRQDSNRFLSPFVQGAGVVGAIAGATLGQDKPKSGEKFQAEVSQSKIPMQAAQIRNQALQAQYDADVRAHNDALKLRKELMDSAAKVQGADISNWSLGQYRGAIPFVEGQEALSMKEAGAMGEEGVKKERQAKAMMPGVQFDKTTGLMLPPNATPAPPPQIFQQHPLLQGLPQYPAPLALERVPTPKPVSPGSRFGQGANAVSGGLAGIQAADAYQRGANDPVGAGLGAISSAGFGATAAGNPKVKALGAAAGVVGGAAQKVWDVFNTKDQTKSVLQPTGEPPKYKKGGAIKKPDGGLSAVEHFQSGGRAGAGKAAWQLGSQQVGKLSDWAQNYLGHYFVPTQSDRMAGVGGTSFSANSLARPEYSNRAWGSGQKATATGIANLAKDPRYGGTERQIFAPLIGSENMHQSNQIVYNELLKQHNKNIHKYSPERVAEINQYMQTGGLNTGIAKQKFDPIPEFNVLDQDLLRKYGDTFDTRKAIANYAFGAEGLGKTKKRIFDYQNILDEMRDPLTQGSPSFSMGPRAFKLSGEVEQIPRADLNEAYPWMLHGKDLDVTYQPVPSELSLRDFQKQWRKDTGNTMPKKSGALKQPGYYEHTAGYTPEGASERVYPRQLITEEWIKDLQSSAFSEGGLTGVPHYDKGGRTGVLTRLGESAYDILKLTPEKIEAWRKANAKPYKQQQDLQLAQALEAYMTGKISQADYLRIMNERRPIRPLTEVPKAHSDTDIASALNKNQVENKGILGVNLFAPEGMRVGNRLDIPAYERFGTYVDTMHDPAGKPIAYGHTGHLKNVEFQSEPNRAIRVGLGTREQGLTPLALEEGQGKAPFAMMVGDNQVTSNDEVRRMLAEALKDPTWRQIGMNPYRGSQFYDKADMQPVFSAAEKIQAGPLVLARDVEKTSWKDPRLKTRYGVNYAKGGLTHL